MSSQGLTTARTVAMAVLNRFKPERNYAGPILDKLLHKTSQKQRATDLPDVRLAGLVFGTIRNRAALDMLITKLADCPVERIPAKLLNIICIGVYTNLSIRPQLLSTRSSMKRLKTPKPSRAKNRPAL